MKLRILAGASGVVLILSGLAAIYLPLALLTGGGALVAAALFYDDDTRSRP